MLAFTDAYSKALGFWALAWFILLAGALAAAGDVYLLTTSRARVAIGLAILAAYWIIMEGANTSITVSICIQNVTRIAFGTLQFARPVDVVNGQASRAILAWISVVARTVPLALNFHTLATCFARVSVHSAINPANWSPFVRADTTVPAWTLSPTLGLRPVAASVTLVTVGFSVNATHRGILLSALARAAAGAISFTFDDRARTLRKATVAVGFSIGAAHWSVFFCAGTGLWAFAGAPTIARSGHTIAFSKTNVVVGLPVGPAHRCEQSGADASTRTGLDGTWMGARAFSLALHFHV